MGKRLFNANLGNLAATAEGLAERERILASTAIVSTSYDFIGSDMTINFADGTSYVYHGVDTDTYVGLVRAGSVGSFFNSNVRNSFPFTKVG